MAAIKNVALVGAGGNIGPAVLDGLTSAGFNTTIISRASSKSSFGDHKVIRVADDYPHAELVKALKGQDAVVSTIQTFGNRAQENLIDAAIEAGVRRFLPSEFGCDNRNDAAVELCPLFKNKREIVEYLRARQDKIEWTSVPSGVFFDWGLKRNFLNLDLETHKAKLVNDGTEKFSASTLAQIGVHVANILKHPKETANQYVPVESLNVSQRDILAALEKATNKKWEVEHLSGEALINGSREGMKAGNHLAIYGLVQASVFLPGYGGSFHDDAVKWMNKFGMKQLDLQEATEEALKA